MSVYKYIKKIQNTYTYRMHRKHQNKKLVMFKVPTYYSTIQYYIVDITDIIRFSITTK